MLWGLFGGTELLSAQFLLSTDTSRNTKARWIVPLIFALKSGRGEAQWGLAAAKVATEHPERLSQPEAAVYQIVSTLSVHRGAQAGPASTGELVPC